MGYVLVAFCGILSGTVTFGGRILSDLDVSLFEISIYRYTIGALILLPFVWSKLYMLKQNWKSLLLLGFIGGALGLAEVGAVVLGAPVALVAFLLYSQPIWTLLLSWLILGEEPTLRKVFALIVALGGVIILFEPWNIQTTEYVSGALLGLFGGVLLSLYIILIRKTHFDDIPAVVGTFGWLIFSIFWFILFYPIVSFFTQNPSLVAIRLNLPISSWLLLLLFALTAEVLPASALFKGSQTVEASKSGIILLLEPISAALLAYIFLEEYLTTNFLIGGLLILIANVTTVYIRPAISVEH